MYNEDVDYKKSKYVTGDNSMRELYATEGTSNVYSQKILWISQVKGVGLDVSLKKYDRGIKWLLYSPFLLRKMW